MSANEQEKFRALERQESEAQTKRLDKHSEFKSLDGDIETLKRSSIQAKAAIDDALKKKEEASKNDARLDLAQKLNHFFADFRDKLRKRKKNKIEQSLNEKFRILMGSNERIKNIQVDDSFTLEYFDENGECWSRKYFCRN